MYIMGRGPGEVRSYSYEDLVAYRLIYIELLAARGLNNKGIAEQLGVSENTFSKWVNEHSELKEALISGRAPVCERVESRLVELALGAQEEVTVESKEIPIVRNGQQVGIQKTEKKTTKHIPNLGAIKYFLDNNRPDKYRDRKNDIVGVADDGIKIINDIEDDMHEAD